MEYILILLLAIPAGLATLAPELGNKIVDFLGGPKPVLSAYITVLILFFIWWATKEHREKKEEEERIRKWVLKNVVKTKLISVNGQGSESFTSTSGAIGRAAIGSLIAGPVGGIIGASTARTHTVTRNSQSKYMFMVYYKNGTRKRDTVTEKDWKFDIYIDRLDLGD